MISKEEKIMDWKDWKSIFFKLIQLKCIMRLINSFQGLSIPLSYLLGSQMDLFLPRKFITNQQSMKANKKKATPISEI